MSAIAQAIVNQIKALSADEQREVLNELAQITPSPKHSASEPDPIRSARGMFAGSRLTEALFASRSDESQHA